MIFMNIPKIENSLLVMVDMQEKLLPAMHDGEECVKRHQVLLRSAEALKLPVIVSEQYPQGLGSTIQELKELYQPQWSVVTKNTFSCFGEQCFLEKLKEHQPATNLIISGIESHVCVLQTALDAVNNDFHVIVVADAVTSRKCADKSTALKLMSQNGIQIMSTESILFMLLHSAAHPAFKTVAKLIR